MRPIYAVIYWESYDLYLVGAYAEYQDAYNGMVQDLKRELMFWLSDDYKEEETANTIISDAIASDTALDDFEEYPGLSVEINEDAGKAYLIRGNLEGTWEIVQITEVIKHQNDKEDNGNE